jgi:hypothetical protein
MSRTSQLCGCVSMLGHRTCRSNLSLGIDLVFERRSVIVQMTDHPQVLLTDAWFQSGSKRTATRRSGSNCVRRQQPAGPYVMVADHRPHAAAAGRAQRCTAKPIADFDDLTHALRRCVEHHLASRLK